MHRTASVGMALIMLVATVGAMPVTGAALAGYTAPSSTDGGSIVHSALAASNHTENAAENDSLPPGARLSGVIGVTQAEFEGSVETRVFGLAVARAATNSSKAEVVRREVSNLTKRLTELEQRKNALKRARANGSISNATYKAKVAELAARTETVRSLADMSEDAAQGLPKDVLESKGVNVTAIQRLKTDAANLTGPQVAAIAQQIAGPQVGPSIAGQRAPGNVSVPGQAGPPNGTPGDGNQAAGPPENGSDGNRTAGPPGNQTAGNQSAGNETRGGSGSGDGGSGSGSGQGSGDGGSGSGAGEGDEGSGGQGGSGGG